MDKKWSIYKLTHRNTDGFVSEMTSCFWTKETDGEWEVRGYWNNTFSTPGVPFIEYTDLTEEICLNWIPTRAYSLEEIEDDILNPIEKDDESQIKYLVEINPFSENED